MKVELKQIVDELSEALGLNGQKVAAVVDFDNPKEPEGKVTGWTICDFDEETGKISPIDESKKYNNLKELFDSLK